MQKRKKSEISLKLRLWSPKQVFGREITVSPQNCLMGLKEKAVIIIQKHLNSLLAQRTIMCTWCKWILISLLIIYWLQIFWGGHNLHFLCTSESAWKKNKKLLAWRVWSRGKSLTLYGKLWDASWKPMDFVSKSWYLLLFARTYHPRSHRFDWKL